MSYSAIIATATLEKREPNPGTSSRVLEARLNPRRADLIPSFLRGKQ